VTASPASLKQRTIFGHPLGLYVLFFTEMWERFSYYGMRALLILYLTKHLILRAQQFGDVLGFSGFKSLLEMIYGPLAIQPLASVIYGTYTSLVYFTPLFGGMLADRILGQRKTVVVGSLLMAAGHFLMAFEQLFLIALMFIIIGNGCFKPNISTQVGNLYPQGDPRRDGAFTIFYMGINLGAFISPLICGTLGQIYGWHYGFTAAGVGMLIGLVVYLCGQRYLAEETRSKAIREKVEYQPLNRREWKAVLGLIALCVLNIAFWAVYEQQGNTLQIFADSNTDWHVFGWEMPSTWFQAMNPMFIFLLSPFLIQLWLNQAKANKEPSSITKMAIGCTFLGLSFLPLIWLVTGMQSSEKISFLWLGFCNFFCTIGELYLSPIGLSLVTKVSPMRVVGLMMGTWFLANFVGNHLTGDIGILYDRMSHAGFFALLAIIAVGTGFAIFALKKPIQHAIGRDV
jgi:POT family proton-dependent oligopeptide transporter